MSSRNKEPAHCASPAGKNRALKLLYVYMHTHREGLIHQDIFTVPVLQTKTLGGVNLLGLHGRNAAAVTFSDNARPRSRRGENHPGPDTKYLQREQTLEARGLAGLRHAGRHNKQHGRPQP